MGLLNAMAMDLGINEASGTHVSSSLAAKVACCTVLSHEKWCLGFILPALALARGPVPPRRAALPGHLEKPAL